jgi:PAS domain S-box-containing protein
VSGTGQAATAGLLPSGSVPGLIQALRAAALNAAAPADILGEAATRLSALAKTPVVVLLRHGQGLQVCAAAGQNGVSVQHLTAEAEPRLLRALEGGAAAAFPFRAGESVVAPVLTARTAAALVAHCGPGSSVELESQAALVASVCAIVLSERELSATIEGQAHDLERLLEISSELGGIVERDPFLQKFVVRAAQFLGYGRAFVALMEEDVCRIRWVAEEGQARQLTVDLRAPLTRRVLESGKPFHTEDVTLVPGINRDLAAAHKVKQYLAIPLIGSNGRSLGMFGVLDRLDGQPISAEDVQRGQALAAQVGLVLEAAQNLHLAEQHRRRAEDLMSLALDLNSSDGLSEFVRRFTPRAAGLLDAASAALVLAQGPSLSTVFVHQPGRQPDRSLLRRLNPALGQLVAARSEPVVEGAAADLLGEVASDLGWHQLTVARLSGAQNELIGLLCLADRPRDLTPADRSLLQAIIGHGAVALENSRLFSRVAQANRQWMEIFDAMTDFIVVHDEAQRILRVNRTLTEFLGVRPSELVGMSMRALTVLAGDVEHPCPFCRTASEGSDEYVHPVMERTYLVSTSRTHGAVQEGLQTIHVIKDITDRREAERRYRELFDNIQEGLFFSTPEGRFIEVNDALVRMLGYGSREELLQVDIPAQLYSSPEHRRRFQEGLEREGVLRNFEDVLRRKDGSLVHTLGNAFAVRDSKGRVLQYRGLILDITELKNFQAQLQHERDFNSKILNNTQSLILVADTAGRITFANRRTLEAGGYSADDLLGRPLTDFVPPAQRAAMQQAFHSTLAGRQVDNLETSIVDARGQQGRFSVNLSPMRDEQGAVTSIVSVMTDITDAAILQAKLMHTEKMAAVGQLVSGVAHEVNNPLTAILGFADLLLEYPDVPEGARKDLKLILQEAQRTKTIVQNLLSFARQMPPQRRPVDVNDVLHRTLQLRQYDFASHGVEVREGFSAELPPVVGDAHQLQQVFLNILNNAYDAVREAGRTGRIEIETSRHGDQAEILFRDNGEGITHPERIFDPFFTTKEVGKGTGLGLSICYGIVREHGGEITCHNNAGAPGATFRVRLPLVTPASQAAAEAAGVLP